MQAENYKFIDLCNNVKKNYFKDCFIKLCEEKKIQSSSKSLSASSDSCKINVNADRIKLLEWEVIFQVLRIENTSKKINIYSQRNSRVWPLCIEDKANTALTASVVQGPVIYTSYVLEKLMQSIAKALKRKESVCEELFIQLPLPPEYCLILSQGLQNPSNLRQLSLSGSCIGNDGCRYICEALKTSRNIRILNLSNCNLGVRAMENFAMLIKCHNLMRQTSAWESSFRYRSPDKNLPIGLIRITLNNNPAIGDEGTSILADAVTEDVWIKALDLQQCNISNNGAVKLLTMLAKNETISIVDIRDNRNVCSYVLQCMDKALQFGSRDASEVQWLPCTPKARKVRKS